MLKAIQSLLFPKARVRLTVHIKHPESLYALQNQLKAYGMPGFARAMPGNILVIELEGNESTLRDRLNELACSPHVMSNYSLKPEWLPYSGNYKYFNFSF